MSLGSVSISFDITGNIADLANDVTGVMQKHLSGYFEKLSTFEEVGFLGGLFDSAPSEAASKTGTKENAVKESLQPSSERQMFSTPEAQTTGFAEVGTAMATMTGRFEKGVSTLSKDLNSLVGSVSKMTATLSGKLNKMQKSLSGFGFKKNHSESKNNKSGVKKRQKKANKTKAGRDSSADQGSSDNAELGTLKGVQNAASTLITNAATFKQSFTELSSGLQNFELSKKGIVGLLDSGSKLTDNFSTLKQSFVGLKASFTSLNSDEPLETAMSSSKANKTSSKKKSDGASGKLQGMKGAVLSGEKLVSTFSNFKKSLTGLYDGVQTFDFSKQGVTGLTDLSSKLVNTYDSGSKLVSSFSSFKQSIAGVSGGLKNAGAGLMRAKSTVFGFATALRSGAMMQWGLNAAMLANPIGLIVGAFVAAGVLIYKYWQPLKAFFSGVFDGFVSSMQPVFTAFQPLLNLLAPVGDAFAWIASKVSEVINWFGALFTPIQSSQAELAGFAASGMKFGEVIGSVFKTALAPIMLVAKGIGWVGKQLGLFGDEGEASSEAATPNEGGRSRGSVTALNTQNKATSNSKLAAIGAGMLVTTSAAAMNPSPDETKALAPAPTGSVVQSYELSPINNGQSPTKEVVQHINVQVTVNNPTSNIDIERAIENVMRGQASTSSPSLKDEDI
ncbi:phage tail tape measure protein [Marinomonas mediterranea]|jgi:hypothetical protein|uniref:Uncharacterized protein n=1 Tax=Marinomonas mediterranea (strain ATCC 700492 / JCM 21426 / NBRC 103028 / MMB-1) TaxID=717774 RepID=F2K1Q7_MARM1|nr:hypothetical protein [Marinomonas mediterranea]ADZ93391.1 hypothetical protein Marme_4192 [Marinomonas mediterranea MMB-1]WCN19385.1 hypothetical protein GV053_21225 [Marinomonas mediterranea MMB-1]